MQPLRKEKQSKSYKCLHCCKSFKSSNGLKYHKEKVHSDEEKMEISSDVETEGNIDVKPSKARSLPQPLDLSPDVNMLAEFARIATSPQSPLVRQVSGDSVYVRRGCSDSPPPQLVDPKKIVNFQFVQQQSVTPDSCLHSSSQTLCHTIPAIKWLLPDENGRNCRVVDNAEILSQNVFPDGLRVVDFERINTNHDENSDEFIVTFKSCNNEESSLQAEITADYPFFVKETPCWASLNPAVTELHYELRCQPLKKGDICWLPYDPGVMNYRSEYTDVSMAALTLSSMAKDKEEHSHRRTKLLSESPCSARRLKRNEAHQFNKRPMNAFMLFAQKFRLEITQAHPGKDNRAISVILGDTWKAMKQEERKQYVIQAKILADEHKRINPDCWKRKRSSEGSSKLSYRRL